MARYKCRRCVDISSLGVDGYLYGVMGLLAHIPPFFIHSWHAGMALVHRWDDNYDAIMNMMNSVERRAVVCYGQLTCLLWGTAAFACAEDRQ